MRQALRLVLVSRLSFPYTDVHTQQSHTHTKGNVEESFDHHPRFTIPKTGYSLDLSKPPPEPDHFQAELESLRRNLKKPTSKKSNYIKTTS